MLFLLLIVTAVVITYFIIYFVFVKLANANDYYTLLGDEGLGLKHQELRQTRLKVRKCLVLK